MLSLSNYTGGCIEWRARDADVDEDYVALEKEDSGCSATVGRNGGRQRINYSSGCFDRYGTIPHEMLHSLGVYHEQARPDRDDHVKINWINIEPGKYHNFEKKSADDVSTWGQEYDYGSVMHYSRTGFSRNGEETITPEVSELDRIIHPSIHPSLQSNVRVGGGRRDRAAGGRQRSGYCQVDDHVRLSERGKVIN